MYLVVLKLAKQVVDFLRLGHEIGRAYEALPTERLLLVEMRQQVLDIEHASNIVGVVLIDGNAAVVVINDTFQHFVERALDVEVYHILPAGHDFLHRLVAKADDALQHALFLLDFLLVGEFKRLFQVVDAQHVVALPLHHLFGQHAAMHEHALQRPEQLAHEEHK